MYGIAEDYMDGVEVPSFVRSCIGDQYFPVDISERYVKLMQEKEIPYDFAYVDALHGFGLGTDTAASGWTKDALEFWQSLE
jgi:hypothetical protein